MGKGRESALAGDGDRVGSLGRLAKEGGDAGFGGRGGPPALVESRVMFLLPEFGVGF